MLNCRERRRALRALAPGDTSDASVDLSRVADTDEDTPKCKGEGVEIEQLLSTDAARASCATITGTNPRWSFAEPRGEGALWVDGTSVGRLYRG